MHLTTSRNGKQEAFWGTLEGRLLNMLDGAVELTLEFLNQATLAWMEIEYNPPCTARLPARRSSASSGPDVLRDSPSSESLRDAFRLETERIQRQSDGRSRSKVYASRFQRDTVTSARDRAYARWDLGRVDLVDERSGTILAPSIRSIKPPTPMAAVL